MLKAYKYRLYPSRKQTEKLQWTLDRTRELYNAALQERKEAYESVRRNIGYYDPETRKQVAKERRSNYYDQASQLPAIKEAREEYKDIHSQILQDV